MRLGAPNSLRNVIILSKSIFILVLVGCDDASTSSSNDDSALFDTWQPYKAVVYKENVERNNQNIIEIRVDDGTWTFPDSLFYLRLMSDHTYISVFDTPDDNTSGTWEYIEPEIILYNFFPEYSEYILEHFAEYNSNSDEITISFHWNYQPEGITQWEDWVYKRRSLLVDD